MGLPEQALKAVKEHRVKDLGRIVAAAVFLIFVWVAANSAVGPPAQNFGAGIRTTVTRFTAGLLNADRGAPSAQGGDPQLEGL
jgi:hypothetical protein